VLFTIFYALDMVAHCVFSMRYWVLSLKVSHLVNKTFDKNFVQKTRLVWYLIMFWIAAQAITEIWFWWEIRPDL
jgi:hypothetical protein